MVALLIAVAGAGAAFAAFRGAGPVPADEPIPGPTTSTTPGFSRDLVLAVVNGTDVPGLASRTAARLQGHGFRIQHVGNAAPADRTVVKHREGGGPIAREFRDRFFPGARVTSGIEGVFRGEVIVHLGADWRRFEIAQDAEGELREEVFRFMKRFLLARQSGSGAEMFLARFAREQYEGGTDLEGRRIELYPEFESPVGGFGFEWLGQPVYERWSPYGGDLEAASEILLHTGFREDYAERILLGPGGGGDLRIMAVMRA